MKAKPTLLLIALLVLSACTPDVAFQSIDPIEKSAVVGGSDLIPDVDDIPDNPDPSPTPASPGAGNDNPPAPTPTSTPRPDSDDNDDTLPSPSPTPVVTVPTPEPTPVMTAQSVSLQVPTLCSNHRTEFMDTNVKMATILEVRVLDISTRAVVCQYSTGVHARLYNERRLEFEVCPTLTANTYAVELIDPVVNSTSLLMHPRSGNTENMVLLQRSSSASPWSLINNGAHVLYDDNFATGRFSSQPPQCDYRATPLVIDTRLDPSQSKGIQLSAPLDGVMFNILGDRGGNKLNQISWVHNPNFMFLVKPNAEGKITGIDELFGDNTRGPDRKFADNGFAALAKWDGLNASGTRRVNKPDSYIDRRDPVFAHLKLWSDVNRDGVAQIAELYRLDEVGIEVIDLNYDAKYMEEDKYGNQIKYKSVVKYLDGRLRLIFDIWFRL